MANLYSEKIMDHYKNPRNRGKMKNPTVSFSAMNPVCGDCTEIELKIENAKITDVAFESLGCAISIASASMLTEFLKGKTLKEAGKLTDEDLLAFFDMPLTPVKQGCAVMSLEALQRAIKSYEK